MFKINVKGNTCSISSDLLVSDPRDGAENKPGKKALNLGYGREFACEGRRYRVIRAPNGEWGYEEIPA